MRSEPAHRRILLEVLFEKHYEALLAYARRRTDELADAEEVVAQTFVVAWRRLGHVPLEEDQQLPWLYGVARKVLANERRGAVRRARLLDRLRGVLRSADPSADRDGPSRVSPVLEAMGELSEADREILRLTAWEGLTAAEAASVLGITPNAATIRLHRARKRLKHRMQKSSDHLKGAAQTRTLLKWKGSTSSASGRDESK